MTNQTRRRSCFTQPYHLTIPILAVTLCSLFLPTSVIGEGFGDYSAPPVERPKPKPKPKSASEPRKQQRAATRKPTQTCKPRKNYSREQTLKIQRDLTKLGYDPGPIDGVYRCKTFYAHEKWARNLKAEIMRRAFR